MTTEMKPRYKRVKDDSLVAESYKTLGGCNPDTSALRNVLAQMGVKAPHTGKRWSEAMLLGLGGGLGFGYFQFEVGGKRFFALGTRHLWQEMTPEFIQGICARIGAAVYVEEKENKEEAAKDLEEVLADGHPGIVWLDVGSLPWYFAPETKKMMVTVAVAHRVDFDSKTVLMDDRATAPLLLSIDELAEARAAITSTKNRLLVVEPPSPSAPDLAKAIVDAIEESIAAQRKPKSRNFGLSGIADLADMIANGKDAKGWPKAYAEGSDLVHALAWTHMWVEHQTGGGALRPLYADFLVEASEVLKKPKLVKVAEQYRKLGAEWTKFADALLPDSIPVFKAVRDAYARRHKILREQGLTGMNEAGRVSKEIASAVRVAGEKAPAAEARTEFLQGLRKRLEALHQAETAAVDALAKAI